MKTVLMEKKCYLCGKVFYEPTPVCTPCHKQGAIKEAEEMSKIKDCVSGSGRTEAAAIAEETEIPVKSVKWYLNKKSVGSSTEKSIAGGKPAGVSISENIFGDDMWLTATGKVDSQSAADLQRHLNDLIEMGWNSIILDLSGISFFSSNGIRVVLTAYKTLDDTGSFRISNPSKNVANVLGMVALDRMLLR